MELFSLFFRYFLENIAALILFYFAGSAILYFTRYTDEHSYLRFFLKILTGLITFVVFISIISTRGKTIFLGLLLLWGIFVFMHRKEKVSPLEHEKRFLFKNDLRVFLELTAVLLVIYCFRFYSFTYQYQGFLNLPQVDFAYYARASYNLITYGIETSIYNPLDTAQSFKDPYHYADLWMNAGLSLLFGEVHLLTLAMVSQTLGITLVWLALCVLVEIFRTPTRIDKAMALLGTFMGPLLTGYVYFINALFAPLKLLKTSPPYYFLFSVWNNTKLFMVYVFLAAGIFCFIRGKRVTGIAIFLSCTFVYTITFVPICTGIFLFLLIQHKYFSQDKKTFTRGMILTLFTTFFIVAFYLIGNIGSPDSAITEVLRIMPIDRIVLRPFVVFLETNLQTILLYIFPVIFTAILLLHKWKTSGDPQLKSFLLNKIKHSRYSPAVVLLCLFYFISICMWAVIAFMPDAPQMYGNLGIIILNMFTFLIFALGIQTRQFIQSALVLFLFGILSLVSFDGTVRDIFEEKIYSDKFIKKVSEVAAKMPDRGGYIRTKQDHVKAIGHPYVDILGQYLFMFRSDFAIEPLSVFDTYYSKYKSDSTLRHHAVRQSGFYKFVENQKKAGTYQSIGKSQIDYIDANNISFLLVTGNTVLDSAIAVRIDSTIRDQGYSEQVLHFLKKK